MGSCSQDETSSQNKDRISSGLYHECLDSCYPAVLTKLLYASPVWLGKNLPVFKNFMSKALLKIVGSQFFPPKLLSEVLLFLPPLELMFHLKCVRCSDHMRGLLLQLEETPTHMFYSHIMILKNYLIYKYDNGESSSLGNSRIRNST